MEKIKIGIAGYGNLGRGVELAIRQNPDTQLGCVFTRRDHSTLKILTEDVPIYHIDEVKAHKDDIDVLILCGGSANDLPVQGPELAEIVNTIDSFDTHAKIPEYFAKVDKAAKEGGNISIISVGWDPGLFSVQRLYGNCILPQGKDYTFWGRGVSQGHSDAIRHVKGVANGKQYTVPIESAVEAVRRCEDPELDTADKHKRVCYVVAEEGADKARIEHDIKTMPNYFADYDTTVNFITAEEFEREHGGMPHGGFVLRSGKTGLNGETSHVIEYDLKLGSNPEFTSSVLVAYARAAYKLAKEGATGARTVFDIAPAYLSPLSGDEIRATML